MLWKTYKKMWYLLAVSHRLIVVSVVYHSYLYSNRMYLMLYGYLTVNFACFVNHLEPPVFSQLTYVDPNSKGTCVSDGPA